MHLIQTPWVYDLMGLLLSLRCRFIRRKPLHQRSDDLLEPYKVQYIERRATERVHEKHSKRDLIPDLVKRLEELQRLRDGTD